MQNRQSGRSLIRRFGVTVVAVATLVTVAACGNSSDPNSAAASSGGSGKRFTIGLASEGLNAPFPSAIAKGAQSVADEHGVKLITLDGKLAEATQQSGIRTLIAQKVDGIIIDPIDPGPTGSMIKLAQAANIPVMLVHGYAGEGAEPVYPGVSYELVENYEKMGAAAGDLTLKAVPNGGKVAQITGTPGYQAVDMLEKGFKSVIDPTGKFEVVATQPGNWTVTDSYNACKSILSAHPDIAVFATQSDDMALGCANAVKAANSKAAITSSIGGTARVSDLIREGAVYGMVCDAPETQGKMAMEAMYKQLTGEKKHDGVVEYYPTPAVTKDNLSSCKAEW